MKEFILEIYQIIFYLSCTYYIYLVLDLLIKIFGRFKLKDDTIRFILTQNEKIILWFSTTIILSYLL